MTEFELIKTACDKLLAEKKAARSGADVRAMFDQIRNSGSAGQAVQQGFQNHQWNDGGYKIPEEERAPAPQPRAQARPQAAPKAQPKQQVSQQPQPQQRPIPQIPAAAPQQAPQMSTIERLTTPPAMFAPIGGQGQSPSNPRGLPPTQQNLQLEQGGAAPVPVRPDALDLQLQSTGTPLNNQ